ncbi:MAG: hypothetical protein JST00_19810 [Deltaproteobacteria bacterium]|nr:hypothetical protein [Deltaproteobacteria bacterium]
MISLGPGAENNAFATMLADLVRQNLESKPHKKKDFTKLGRANRGRGVSIALVADDADVALTLEFRDGRLVLHDGIKGVPDVAVRGSSDAIMTMSNIPLTRPLGLPIPFDRGGLDVLKDMARMTRTKEVQVFGMLGNFGVLSALTRVMSVNG